MALLKQPIATTDRARLQHRIGELIEIFQTLNTDQKTVLRRRLDDPTDALARLFDCELHHESRHRLRALLQGPHPPEPATQPHAQLEPRRITSPCLRGTHSFTALLPWEKSFLALVNDSSLTPFEAASILIGPNFPGGSFSWHQKAIVTTALKSGNAITMGNTVWFPSPIDTSTTNNEGMYADLGWLVHESVHLLDYERVGIEAFLTSYIMKAIVAGFSHDDIPDERRADHYMSAALGLLGTHPELARLISTCDNDAILADLASRRDVYRQAVIEAMPEAPR